MEKTMRKTRMSRVGLCSSCISESSCTFPRRPGVRVIDCLEFQGEIRAETVRSPKPATPAATDSAPQPRTPGLCSWCDRMPTCTFPKPAGGVWFCEEYQ
jgi:hypothetical protein